ncbi:hypothetical protein NLG97_g2375 [Lecanicillium saksenae]|uniref:Uncharacterized protein n=1 Tax=Lecanicillium saksenae TaxID=468837 RepID=A0ACC1R2I2_9HYPO|nr:hypothetical protein NLG97_g2375 [Lecanicillium saksenae]
MDFLPLPPDPTIETPETPFLSSEDWDLGPFCTYLNRKHLDLGLAEAPDLPINDARLTVKLQWLFDAIPAPKLQAFVQTWLFFGLLAEFLSLNELEDGTRLVSHEEAREELASLYREFSKESDNGKLLIGKPLLAKSAVLTERLNMSANIGSRFHYLHWCLTRSMLIINNCFNQLDYSVHYSITGLGEFFVTKLHADSYFTNPRTIMPTAGFNWFRHYMKAGGDLEEQMLNVGWCPSQIENIRNYFQGVSSLHYISRLRPQTKRDDHANCSTYSCQAFQIDMAKYKPRHTSPSCQCEDLCVDETELTRMLRTSGSYPVLRINTGGDNTTPVQITMETYEEGVNYVALSHVWADGLGNPHSNALPSCQVIKIAQSVAQLNQSLNSNGDAGSEYRVWVDTICCPVELGGKAIALERIADVYRNSTHVLVFDSSVSVLNTATSDIAEMLLRTFCCSAWMRRLWTLQEAILPKSLCVQFEDKAIPATDLMRDLYLAGMNDKRLLRIWHDLGNQFNFLRSPEDASRSLEDIYHYPQLLLLTRAIHFRTVSVPSDEPLCLAVLMSLEIEGLTLMRDGEERMARVWAAIAERFGGISTALVFFLEDTLSMKGWRWAPKSLLGGLGKDSTLDLDSRSLRFSVSKPVTPFSLGRPTPRGLRMKAKGGYLKVTPLRENFDLLPWSGVTKRTVEPYVTIYHEALKRWFRLADWHRSHKLGGWSDEERKDYDEKHPTPLFDCIQSNKSALIIQNFDLDAELMVAVLGTAADGLDDDGEQQATVFERERTVMFIPLGDNYVRLINKVIAIADKLAGDQVTSDLLACGKDPNPARAECLGKVKEWLENTVAQVWKEDPEFAELVRQTMGEDMEGSAWPMVILESSNLITMNDTEEDHVCAVIGGRTPHGDLSAFQKQRGAMLKGKGYEKAPERHCQQFVVGKHIKEAHKLWVFKAKAASTKSATSWKNARRLPESRESTSTLTRAPPPFWHNGSYFANQMWLDGIFMGDSFYAKWTRLFDSNNETAWNDVLTQFTVIGTHTRNSKSNLLVHGWADPAKAAKWADPNTGKAPHVWGRAVGWYFMALMETLQVFPESHPGYKRLLSYFVDLASGVQQAQDNETGGWWQVMDEPSPGMKGNYIEASGSAMFTYGLLKGINLGYLDQDQFLGTAKSAYQGLIEQFIEVDDSGTVHYKGTVQECGLAVDDPSFEYYTIVPTETEDYKGSGPFMLAAYERETWASKA